MARSVRATSLNHLRRRLARRKVIQLRMNGWLDGLGEKSSGIPLLWGVESPSCEMQSRSRKWDICRDASTRRRGKCTGNFLIGPPGGRVYMGSVGS